MEKGHSINAEKSMMMMVTWGRIIDNIYLWLFFENLDVLVLIPHLFIKYFRICF